MRQQPCVYVLGALALYESHTLPHVQCVRVAAVAGVMAAVTATATWTPSSVERA